MHQCPRCQSPLAADARGCTNCGTPVVAAHGSEQPSSRASSAQGKTLVAPRSRRLWFWLYLLAALPTIYVILVVRPSGDTNLLMWYSSIAALVLSLPWLVVFASILGGPKAIAASMVLNVFLLWFLTRPRRTRGQTASREDEA